jgi:hypothetical protein
MVALYLSASLKRWRRGRCYANPDASAERDALTDTNRYPDATDAESKLREVDRATERVDPGESADTRPMKELILGLIAVLVVIFIWRTA